jgi:hypothetical protein
MTSDSDDLDKDPFLISLGERLKLLRARRGLTRLLNVMLQGGINVHLSFQHICQGI